MHIFICRQSRSAHVACTSEGTYDDGTAKQITPDDIAKMTKDIKIGVSLSIQFLVLFTNSPAPM